MLPFLRRAMQALLLREREDGVVLQSHPLGQPSPAAHQRIMCRFDETLTIELPALRQQTCVDQLLHDDLRSLLLGRVRELEVRITGTTARDPGALSGDQSQHHAPQRPA